MFLVRKTTNEIMSMRGREEILLSNALSKRDLAAFLDKLKFR